MVRRCIQIVIILLVTLIGIIYWTEVVNADPIKLTIESTKNEYVIKEPVRLKVTIKNVSDIEQRIWPVDKAYLSLKRHLQIMSIITPEGIKELRQIPHHQINWLRGGGVSHYKGEPIAPGDSLVTFISISTTILRGDVTRKEILEDKERHHLTFHQPGAYKISIVYQTSSLFVELFHKEGGLHSNQIEIKFRKPTPVEEEILDSCRDQLQALNGYRLIVREVGEMPELIEKYPHHPLIKYLEYLVGVNKYTKHQYSGAVKYFRAFSRKYVDFRFYETCLVISKSYLRMGDKEKAVAVIDSALTVKPFLKDFPDLMKIKAVALHGEQGYKEWLKARGHGRDLFSKEPERKIKKE